MSNHPALRALRIEGLRSAAPLLLLATAGTGIVLLFVHVSDWAARWMGLATYLWTDLILLVPLVAAVACWQAGRERRRGLQELLGSTPRPGWQPLATGWAALSLAATLGFGLTWGVGAWFVAPQASYAGGGWAWLTVTAVVPLSAAAGLGFAVGRGIPSRLIGLPLAVALYGLIGLSDYSNSDGGKRWLVPFLDGSYINHRLEANTYLWQALWFGTLAVGLLAIAAILSRPPTERREISRPVLTVAVLALVVAGTAAVVLGSGPGTARWIPDRASEVEVCTQQGPPVCVTKVDAFLLDEMAAKLQPALLRLTGVPGAPTRADEAAYDQSAPLDALRIDLPAPDLRGRLVKPGPAQGDLVADSVSSLFGWCVTDSALQPSIADSESQQGRTASDVATAWTLGTPANQDAEEQSGVAIIALRALPTDAQRIWISDYLQAARTCDTAVLPGLLSRVGVR